MLFAKNRTFSQRKPGRPFVRLRPTVSFDPDSSTIQLRLAPSVPCPSAIDSPASSSHPASGHSTTAIATRGKLGKEKPRAALAAQRTGIHVWHCHQQASPLPNQKDPSFHPVAGDAFNLPSGRPVLGRPTHSFNRTHHCLCSSFEYFATVRFPSLCENPHPAGHLPTVLVASGSRFQTQQQILSLVCFGCVHKATDQSFRTAL